MKNFKTCFFILCTVAVLSSCTIRVMDFTLLSTKSVPLSNSANFKKGSDVYTEDVLHLIFAYPISEDFPTTPDPKEVVDMAIESVPGCVALADGILITKIISFLFYTKFSYVVEGKAIVDPSLVSSTDRVMPKYAKFSIDKAGEKHIQSLSCDEYQALKSKITKGGKKTKLSSTHHATVSK